MYRDAANGRPLRMLCLLFLNLSDNSVSPTTCAARSRLSMSSYSLLKALNMFHFCVTSMEGTRELQLIMHTSQHYLQKHRWRYRQFEMACPCSISIQPPLRLGGTDQCTAHLHNMCNRIIVNSGYCSVLYRTHCQIPCLNWTLWTPYVYDLPLA